MQNTLNVYSIHNKVSCSVELSIHTTTECHPVQAHHRKEAVCRHRPGFVQSQAVDVEQRTAIYIKSNDRPKNITHCKMTSLS